LSERRERLQQEVVKRRKLMKGVLVLGGNRRIWTKVKKKNIKPTLGQTGFYVMLVGKRGDKEKRICEGETIP